MRRLTVLFFGVVLGFVAAHLINQHPRGRSFFARLNSGSNELAKAFISGYRAAEQEQQDAAFASALADLEDRK